MFSLEELLAWPVLRYFTYDHLPERLQPASRLFAETARKMVDGYGRPDSNNGTRPGDLQAELALQSLLDAKDRHVRAMLNLRGRNNA